MDLSKPGELLREAMSRELMAAVWEIDRSSPCPEVLKRPLDEWLALRNELAAILEASGRDLLAAPIGCANFLLRGIPVVIA